jgi:hypothetical protein
MARRAAALLLCALAARAATSASAPSAAAAAFPSDADRALLAWFAEGGGALHQARARAGGRSVRPGRACAPRRVRAGARCTRPHGPRHARAERERK